MSEPGKYVTNLKTLGATSMFINIIFNKLLLYYFKIYSNFFLCCQVRLVTGVGRFTEMNYIFQILKENDQFESLLGQGLDKVSLVIQY